MRLRILAILLSCLLLNGNTLIIQSGHLAIVEEAAGVDYSDIIFHTSLDTIDGNAEKSGGSATVDWDVGVLLNTADEVVGTGCADSNNDAYDGIAIVVAGNVDYISGRLGFYFNPQEASDGEMCNTTGDDIQVSYKDSDIDIYTEYGDSGSATTNTTLSIGTWYFVEFKFDSNVMTTYVNGVYKANQATNSAGTLNDTVMNFLSTDGTAWDALIDNIICSNDPNRDLNAVKDVTDFS